MSMKVPGWIAALALAAIAAFMIYSFMANRPFYINGEYWGSSEIPLLKTSFSKSIYSTRRKTVQLGDHQFCSLASMITHSQAQACGCEVARTTDKGDAEWTLRVNLDEGAQGACSCQAVCIDF